MDEQQQQDPEASITTPYHFQVEAQQSINMPIVQAGENWAVALLMAIDAPISFIERLAEKSRRLAHY
jgi:hypothetical protein